MVDHTHYTYRVIWSEEDQEHVALCVEFPSLSYLDSSPDKALKNLLKVVKDVVLDKNTNGETPPEPLTQKTYSGKFMVRIPPDQHRNLSILAAEQGVSLNRYVSSKLV